VPWYTILAIYFIVWWLVFFTVLPWGIRSQEHADVVLGTDPGAPRVHGLKAKLVWTTAVSAIVFAIFYWAFVSRAVAFEDLVTFWGLLKP
jgi:predicted secreted protein